MKRSESPSYILTLPIKTTISDNSALEKYFELSRKYYNAILGKLNKRVKLMRESKEYQQTRKLTNKKEKRDGFKQLEIKYGIKGTALNELITSLRNNSNDFKVLGSHITIQLQLRAMQAIDKVRFDNGKQIHFIKYGEMTSIQGSNNEQAIRYRDGIIQFNKLKMPVIIKNSDDYAQLAIQDRVKFCRILRKHSKGKIKYYVQLCLEGIPPTKLDKNGNIKHKLGIGEVGLDIGTSTIAIASDDKVKLLELASSIDNIDKEKCRLQRKLDRSRRANNSNKFNEDGTIKKGNKDKWIKSNNYIKTQSKLRDIQRRIANKRKKSHEELANYILSLGNIIKVEIMHFNGLQRKAKETTINEKTGRYNKKKRFGKSLANKAPAKLLEIINRKLKYQGLQLYKINTYKVKASQYNPLTDECNKKTLGERWNKNIEIQRDLLSALIIKNVIIDIDNKGNIKADTIDKYKLLSEFDSFKVLHDKEISRLRELKNSGVKLLSSMGI